MDILFLIEKLLQYGEANHLIGERDKIVARNTLLDLYGLAEPYNGELDGEIPELPSELLAQMVKAGAAKGLFDKEVNALAINFEARIMGALMPRQSEVEAQFAARLAQDGAAGATDYFYDLCIKANYIRTAEIAKNIKWNYASRYGTLEITINMTKPEKDPKTIALERLAPASGYPKCMLCLENIGYAGRVNFPARQTHRVVPLTLGAEQWYLQYSPYVYYNEHCIVFCGKHEPMRISEKSIGQLFDFVIQYPHYTCGSNADLPIVGGSILSHMHFQGGKYVFPMQNTGAIASFANVKYKELRFEILNWPVSTLRVSGADADKIKAFAGEFLAGWREYQDESVDILAYSEQEGVKTPHNTVTPILHCDARGDYILDLVPRNNRTSAEYPEGIFHPHREIHHIKKENIGLIEVMGLAVLPSRLALQSELIAKVLTGEETAQNAKVVAPEHSEWIDELLAANGAQNSADLAQQIVQIAIGDKFATCLEHAGVFKLTQEGRAAFTRFLATLACAEI